jgi:hypothetical protein
MTPRGWAQAQNLEAGDAVLGLRAGIVKGVEKLLEGPVVKITTSGKTYISDGILSHNLKAQ